MTTLRELSLSRLVDQAATDVAAEEVPGLFSGEAVGRSLQNLAGAIGNGVSDAGAEEGLGWRPNSLSSRFQSGWRIPLKPPIELSNINVP